MQIQHWCLNMSEPNQIDQIASVAESKPHFDAGRWFRLNGFVWIYELPGTATAIWNCIVSVTAIAAASRFPGHIPINADTQYRSGMFWQGCSGFLNLDAKNLQSAGEKNNERERENVWKWLKMSLANKLPLDCKTIKRWLSCRRVRRAISTVSPTQTFRLIQVLREHGRFVNASTMKLFWSPHLLAPLLYFHEYWQI